MQATLALREKMAQLLAADATTLAQAADANLLKLVNAAFTPSEASAIGDLSFANFDGSTPIEVELLTQPEGLDPNSTDAIISLSPPVGGFRWETTGVTNLPQTIYGYALTNAAGTVLFGCERFPATIPLSGVNQVLTVDNPTFRLRADSLT